jgi:hypothetical protein
MQYLLNLCNTLKLKLIELLTNHNKQGSLTEGTPYGWPPCTNTTLDRLILILHKLLIVLQKQVTLMRRSTVLAFHFS